MYYMRHANYGSVSGALLWNFLGSVKNKIMSEINSLGVKKYRKSMTNILW